MPSYSTPFEYKSERLSKSSYAPPPLVFKEKVRKINVSGLKVIYYICTKSFPSLYPLLTLNGYSREEEKKNL